MKVHPNNPSVAQKYHRAPCSLYLLKSTPVGLVVSGGSLGIHRQGVIPKRSKQDMSDQMPSEGPLVL